MGDRSGFFEGGFLDSSAPPSLLQYHAYQALGRLKRVPSNDLTQEMVRLRKLKKRARVGRPESLVTQISPTVKEMRCSWESLVDVIVESFLKGPSHQEGSILLMTKNPLQSTRRENGHLNHTIVRVPTMTGTDLRKALDLEYVVPVITCALQLIRTRSDKL